MTRERRPNERIAVARREALRARLIGEGLLPDQADLWIATWERHAGPPTGAGWWEDGHGWIRGHEDLRRVLGTPEP